jgi:hypothetical protein
MSKVVWGKGDSLRILDVVNPQDYSDPFNTDVEGRKIAQALIKVDWRTGMVGKLEAVYVPFFQGDYLPLEGIWAPKAFTAMRAKIREDFRSSAYTTLTGGGITYPAAAIIAAARLMPDGATASHPIRSVGVGHGVSVTPDSSRA